MNSPIQKDGSSQASAANPLAPDNAANENNDEPTATIHDSRNAIMEAAVERETENRTAENAAEGFDVNAAPGAVSPDPGEGNDDLDGFRGDPNASSRQQPGQQPDQQVQQQPTQQQQPNIEEGVTTQQPMHQPAADPNALSEEYIDDPLAEFLVQDENDEVFFRAKVNGQETLIPLDKARDEIQKSEAASQRLQKAAEQQRALDQREQNIAQQEQALQTRMHQMHTPNNGQPAPSADAAVDDEALAEEAKGVVSTFFTGSEDEASAKLVALLKKNRGASATQPTVDPQAIAAEAVTAARQQLSDEAAASDAQAGFDQFKADYPELMADENLFRYADSMTDTIRAEHPEWMPSQVMLEAGKRTREWLTSMGSSPQGHQPQTDRQERKRQHLRPIPRLRQGSPAAAAQEQVDTPQSVLAEVRASRGQSVN